MYKFVTLGPNCTHGIIHGNFMMRLASKDCCIIFYGFYKRNIHYFTIFLTEDTICLLHSIYAYMYPYLQEVMAEVTCQ